MPYPRIHYWLGGVLLLAWTAASLRAMELAGTASVLIITAPYRGAGAAEVEKTVAGPSENVARRWLAR
ncbi:MAG: hypothetical protein ACK4RK_04020 [Gemmataceae bacterium]